MKFLLYFQILFWVMNSYSQTKINSQDFYYEIEELNNEISKTVKKTPYKISVTSNQIINVLAFEYKGQFTKPMFLSNLYLNNLSPLYLTKKQIFRKKLLLDSYSIILDKNGKPIKISDGKYVFYCDSTDLSIKMLTKLYLEEVIEYCFWISGTPLDVYFCVGKDTLFILKGGEVYNKNVYIDKYWDEFSKGEVKPFKEILKQEN